MKIKVSGITCEQDAVWASNMGVDYISFSLIKDDSQKISINKFKDICQKIPPYVVPIVAVDCVENLVKILKIKTKTGLKLVVELWDDITEQDIEIYKNKHSDILFLKKITISQFTDKIAAKFENIDYLQVNFDKPYNQDSQYIENWQNIKDSNVNTLISYESFIGSAEVIKDSKIRENLTNLAPYGVDINESVSRLARRKDYDLLHKIIQNIKKI